MVSKALEAAQKEAKEASALVYILLEQKRILMSELRRAQAASQIAYARLHQAEREEKERESDKRSV